MKRLVSLLWLGGLIAPAGLNAASAPSSSRPQTDSPVMLAGSWVPADSRKLDFDHLPHLPTQHATISDVSAHGGVNQHNYLLHYEGRFWAMWSDGPRREDMGGQIVKYATSQDGLNWDQPRPLTGYPPRTEPGTPHYNTRDPEGMRYIARGFWVREGQLLALVSLDESVGFFGPSLALHSFRWEQESSRWTDQGVLLNDAINNFSPERLPDGNWGMICRPHDYVQKGVRFMIGGSRSINDWISVPVVGGPASVSGLQAEEPIWYPLPSGALVALFRDNGRSGFLFRAFSNDGGHTWTPPVKTDFPDARSKLSALRLHDGRYVLVSNSNPAKRDPLTLAVSRDGVVFDQLYYLTGGRQVDYPHVIEQGRYLYIAYAGVKMSIELLRVETADLSRLAR